MTDEVKFLGTEEDELRQRIDLLEATVEMLGRRNKRLVACVQLVHDALDLETWDGRWSNRLMQAHQVAGGMLADSSVPLGGPGLSCNDRLGFRTSDHTSGHENPSGATPGGFSEVGVSDQAAG